MTASVLFLLGSSGLWYFDLNQDKSHSKSDYNYSPSNAHSFELALIRSELINTAMDEDYSKLVTEAGNPVPVPWLPDSSSTDTSRLLVERACYVLGNTAIPRVKEQALMAFVRSGASFHWFRIMDADFEQIDLGGITLRTPFAMHRVENRSTIYFSPNLSGLRFRGSLFQFGDFSGCNFYGTDLRDSDFSNAILRDCDLVVSDLSGSTFVGTDLTGSRLAYVALPPASEFKDAILVDVDFEFAIVPNKEWLQDVELIADIDASKWKIQHFPNGVGDGWGDHTLYRISKHNTSEPCFAIIPHDSN